MNHLRFALLPLSLLAFACSETVESTDVRTTGIYPEIDVVADGSGRSKVTVKLKVGGDDSNTFLDLTGKDTLEATVEDETKTLDQSDKQYSASFDVDAEGTEFTVAFLRGGEDTDAPVSKVRLPAPFELDIATTEASRADDSVQYDWEPAGDGAVAWSLSGDCIKLDSGTTPDDGTNVIAAGEIETFRSDEEESCTVDLEVTRTRTGSIDPAFTEGGRIRAKQIRGASFTSNP